MADEVEHMLGVDLPALNVAPPIAPPAVTVPQPAPIPAPEPAPVEVSHAALPSGHNDVGMVTQYHAAHAKLSHLLTCVNSGLLRADLHWLAIH